MNNLNKLLIENFNDLPKIKLSEENNNLMILHDYYEQESSKKSRKFKILCDDIKRTCDDILDDVFKELAYSDEYDELMYILSTILSCRERNPFDFFRNILRNDSYIHTEDYEEEYYNTYVDNFIEYDNFIEENNLEHLVNSYKQINKVDRYFAVCAVIFQKIINDFKTYLKDEVN